MIIKALREGLIEHEASDTGGVPRWQSSCPDRLAEATGSTFVGTSRSWSKRVPIVLRDVGREYIGLSVTKSSRRIYESGFRSWCTFRSLTGAPRCLQVEESESERIQALIAFAAWCCSSVRNREARFRVN